MQLGDLVEAASLDVLHGTHLLDRDVGAVRVVRPEPSELRAASTELLVVDWAPARKGGPLPLLGPVLRAAAARPPAAVLVLGDRAVVPPIEAVDAARDADLPLLWSTATRGMRVVHQRIVDLLRTDRLADARLVEIIEGPADVAALTERLGRVLGVPVAVVDDSDRTVAQSADGPPTADVVRLPLVHAGQVLGELWVGTTEGSRAVPAATRSLMGVLALALRHHIREQTDKDAAQELLRLIISDDVAERERAVRRSRRLAVFPRRPAVIVVLVAFDAPVGASGLQRLLQLITPAVRVSDPRATLVAHDGAVVLLVGADVNLDRMMRSMQRRVSAPLAAGAGDPVDDVRRFAGGYRQAWRAAVIGRRTGNANVVSRHRALGVLRILYLVPEHERQLFTHEVLGALAGTDPEAVEGRRVLRAFREANGNVAEAARRLYLHHNTLRQRLGRLQQHLGDFVEDADVRSAVFVALDLHRLDAERRS